MIMREAFTMIEMMVVLGIIGLIFSFIGPQIQRYQERAKKTGTEAGIARIKTAIMEYQMDVADRKVPSTAQGLQELISSQKPGFAGPYIQEKDLVDQWGNELLYSCPPEHFKKEYKKYEIVSYGPTEGDTGEKEKWLHGGF